jgi:hypothetical protein
MHGVRRVLSGIGVATALAVAAPAAAHAQSSSGVWDPVVGTPPTTHNGQSADIRPDSFKAFTLDSVGLKSSLKSAPKAGLKTRSLAAGSSTVLTLPAPNGGYQRFRVEESEIMEPGLAALHPDIKTYDGVGIDDPTASVAADTSSLGFHASVRAAGGSWYVDPYYHLDNSVYISYFGRDLVDNPHGTFVENGVDDVSSAFDSGSGKAAAATATIPLRTYRLALVTDPSYSTYWGGPANVTAAKVTLMNRVDQFYEDETSIRMVLIANNDKLNLDTTALATGANGPCGASPCYSASQISTCGSSTLSRNRIVIGQIIGASNYDIGHIGLGVAGGGIASLGVVGGNNKAQGCTGVPTPVGDYYAIDYVAHEMGHEFAGNHTFNGTQSNCSGGNRNAGTSVEPGSGTSVMAYAGICQTDNLQPHSDPYWSERSYDEITAYTSTARAPISEVQTASLTGFDGTDSFTLGYGGITSAPFVRGTNYTAADIAASLLGNEVQVVSLTGYDTNGDSYTLGYKGANTVPIVRGQNNTAAGITNAIMGGNEQQQATLAGFNGTTQSFQISLGGNNSVVLGAGGLAVSNANVTTAINGIAGFAGGATATGAGNTGFSVTFAGASAGVDVPALSIVNCTGACTSTVRENAKGGAAMAGWPAGATVAVGTVTDTGYSLGFGGTLQHTDVDPFSVTNGTGATGTVAETTKGGGNGILPAGATVTVAGFGGAATFDDTGFQVTFGGTLANLDLPSLAITATGATAFIGETAEGGPVNNLGYLITDTGDHAPVVTTAPAFTIPTRTPFALTGSATDEDGNTLTYMWEENDRGGTTGTGLVSNTKTNGPLFRQFGTYANVSPTDTLTTPSPNENNVTTNPTRVFPDMAQIAAGNTNAATGACPPAVTQAATIPQPIPIVDCFSEFLPTADWVGFLGDRTMNFRLTARDGHVGGGGVGSAATQLTIAPLAGPFRVTSQAIAQSLYSGSSQLITWDVAGTASPPVNAAQVKISLSTDGGLTFPYVLDAATANDGSDSVLLPAGVTAGKSRIKVEAIGNVFFDMSHTDIPIVAAPTAPVSGTVPATLSLTLGTPAAFGAFTPGLTKDYNANMSATVISTAGDGMLSVADPATTNTGHLVNGAFALPSILQAKASSAAGLGTAFANVGGSAAPTSLLTYAGPTSNDAVTIAFLQHIGSTDALRTGTYNKTLTFTLSTTTP